VRSALRDPEVVYQRRWFTLIVLCISLLVIGLDNTILNVALPTLVKDLHASASELQWIVDSYTIVFAGLLLTAGSLGDRFGRYKGLVLGLTIFGAGSAVSAFAGSAGMLIATRAVMGIGGAFIMPSTLSILTNVFTNPVERGKAIGIWAGVSALGIGVGPVVGGFLLTHLWWGSVFLVNVPVVIVGLVAGYFLVPESKDPSAPRLDPLGSILSIAGLGVLLWAVIEAPSHGWGSKNILLGFAVGVVIIGAFMAWELTYSSPMLDLRFFENPRFSAASGAITLTFFALFGTIFLLTQYLQSVLEFSALKAGALLLPQAMVLMVVASSSSFFVQRAGNKIVVATGLTLVTLSLLLFATLTPHSSALHVIGVTIVLGLGMGNVMAPATDSIMGSLPRAKAGVGSAVNDTTRQMGGAVGVAVLGSILASRYSSHVDSLLGGRVPGEVLSGVRDNVGQAIGFAHGSPAAEPFRGQLVDAAKESFVSGRHVAVFLAAAVAALAAIGVVLWLPARARDEEPGYTPMTAAQAAEAAPAALAVEEAASVREAEDVRAAAAPDGDEREALEAGIASGNGRAVDPDAELAGEAG
jgi:EmrB/QacA subfamily drug resistance transporter